MLKNLCSNVSDGHFPKVPPVVKDLGKQLLNTAAHAAVFSYVSKKVSTWMEPKKRVATTDNDKG